VAIVDFQAKLGASDWSRWRGPDGNGISKESDWKPQALAPAPKIAWRNNVGSGHSSVLVVGKRLYTMGNVGGKDFFYCLETEKGRLIWQSGYVCPAGNFPGPRATPALDGELLYGLSRQGHAVCVETEAGKVKWQKNLILEFGAKNVDYGLAGSPLVVGDAVIYNVGAHGIALNRTTGEKIWASPGGPCGYASPVSLKFKGKEAVAIFGASDLFILEAQTGDRLDSIAWHTQFDANAADPVGFEGKLFITSAWDRGCALLDLSDGKLRPVWENKNFRGHFASPICLDGSIYGVDGNTPNGELRCIDAATGSVKWTQKGGFESVSVAGGKLLALDKRGVLTVAEAVPTGYKEIVKAAIQSPKAKNWTAPVLSNGFLYCRNSDGELVCIDVR
jgi:outer membrane protein assembly factor BamB